METSPVIIWLRHDFRLWDNPALYTASTLNRPVLCVYIDDDVTDCRKNYAGGASRWWNHYALISFKKKLEEINGTLLLRKGNPKTILNELIKATKTDHVLWNRIYSPDEVTRDTKIKSALKEQGLKVETFAATLLMEPHTVKNKEGGVYKVYSPFRRAVEATNFDAHPPYDPPKNIQGYDISHLEGLQIEDIFPLPTAPNWAEKLERHWDITEDSAIERVKYFAERAMEEYKTGRDFPAKDYVSRLSPYLARGMITPRKIMDMIKPYPSSKGKTHFISEILWREFAAYLLFHFPHMTSRNFRPEWDDFPWENNMEKLQAWQQGETGFPIIDAAMKELRQTGYMHNRTRMLVGSFLVKNLLIDWKHGEEWFRDNLVDFDVASNIASWQWVAGSGADAAPYFRIFNPILQSKKFDGDGEYIKTYLPQLKDLNNKDIHEPWEAPLADLIMKGVNMGKNYPYPICDLQKSRDKALEVYHGLKEKNKDNTTSS